MLPRSAEHCGAFVSASRPGLLFWPRLWDDAVKAAQDGPYQQKCLSHGLHASPFLKPEMTATDRGGPGGPNQRRTFGLDGDAAVIGDLLVCNRRAWSAAGALRHHLHDGCGVGNGKRWQVQRDRSAGAGGAARVPGGADTGRRTRGRKRCGRRSRIWRQHSAMPLLKAAVDADIMATAWRPDVNYHRLASSRTRLVCIEPEV